MLSPGTKLGPHEIVAAIGAGGMGEVYRARDTKLGREVALKVLPEAFAADAERMGRFEREAKVLALLNHPNIASIYGFEDSSGAGTPARALVMELVEGPTLDERIAKGAIPIDEALPIAKQICEGLEYAHERGIIHRDLKPANVKITPDGAVKILDFGLAKALAGEAAASDPSSSPTLSHLATQAGIILGTAAYMSPEQAKGKPVDRRADIWAFGCVLFEMLTRKHAFDGETVTDILAAVVMKEPDWTALPANTPHRIRELLARCLTKEPRQRLRDIGDARIALEAAGLDTLDVGTTSGQAQDQALQPWRRVLPWALVGALAIVAAISTIGYFERAPEPERAVVAQISPPPGTSFARGGISAGPPALSPDGTRLAFVAVGSDGKQRLFVRPLGAVTAQSLEGTEGAAFPFWSPDSRSLGFFANGKLNRIDAAGGPVIAVADAPNARGGAWGPDGTILFNPGFVSPLFRVPASGGTPQPVTKLVAFPQEGSHGWPQFLPDGKHFLFYAEGPGGQNNATYAGSLEGADRKLLVRNASSAVYAEPGYLLFIRQGTLMAQQFDASSLRLMGDAVPLAEHAESSRGPWGAGHGIFSVSANGVLTYAQGEASGANRLLWYDRSGKQIAETGPPGEYGNLSLSPDGRKLAVTLGDPATSSTDVWVYDLTSETRRRLTFSPFDIEPAWSADGKTIAFVSNRSGADHLYEKASDGTGKTAPLLAGNAVDYLPSWSADGRYLLFGRRPPGRLPNAEVWALPLFGDRKPFAVVQGPQSDVDRHALSSDMKWLAYESAESGRPEIYIVPFLHGSGKWLVSTNGGSQPRWQRDGKELFYLSPENKLMAAEVSEQGSAVAIGKVAPLFQANPASPLGGEVYDVSPDGRKFVVVSAEEQKTAPPLTLVVNWPALLKKQ